MANSAFHYFCSLICQFVLSPCVKERLKEEKCTVDDVFEFGNFSRVRESAVANSKFVFVDDVVGVKKRVANFLIHHIPEEICELDFASIRCMFFEMIHYFFS